MDPITYYLKDGSLLDGSGEAHWIKAQVSWYWLSPDQKMYIRSFSIPYLTPKKCKIFGLKAVVGVMLVFDYQPIGQGARATGGPTCKRMPQSTPKSVTSAKNIRRSSINQDQKLHPITSPWPFAQWGLNILGPFPKASASRRFLLVAIDYFTKWVEIMPLVNIANSNVKTFLWENIVTRFGIPKILVADNGSQFKSRKITTKLGIRQSFSRQLTPYKWLGKAGEASNKVILEGLKKRLEDAKGNWVKELPSVLWAFRTIAR